MPGKEIDRVRARSAWATVRESPVITAIAVAPFALALGVVWWLFGGIAALVLLVVLGGVAVYGGKLLR
ncbi:hypothetical protein GV794_09555 [Nocardia cyriacigeorgica]|uniref:Uncharacterized protein n=1 Tax=Nocardia cyriacigeorgica TaxID=135487 RepID=A0A6P1D500_9NOCA|nr:hypothetical protein [Nocardia cyriacigeorgica]NEW41289.1 hypothetical protein [Nocardia cyriacigeorgica]NEW44541.1 hypothetical protein [Nocardia cyriacigeorgica]NEW52192.1 hypothetical protein [Nocardia cyriacigeorgica]NEW55899.1 hypothetical protein [Nocardia cyriacigeorgica]